MINIHCRHGCTNRVIIEALFVAACGLGARALTQPTRLLTRHLLEKKDKVFYTVNLVLNRPTQVSQVA